MEERPVLHHHRYGEFDSFLYEDQVIRERDPETKSLWVTFNFPEKLNAGPIALWDWLPVLFAEVERDDGIKSVVLRGAGGNFGTGGDATELGYYIGYGPGKDSEGKRRPSQRRRVGPDRDVNFGARGFEQALHRCSKVTIVQAEGYCYGAHLQLAMLADMVIASEDALFTHPAFRYLGPFINVIPLVESMGIKKFKELVLTGRPFSAEEMERAGMVNRVVPRDKLEETVREYVRAVSLMPLDGIVMGKGLIEQAMEARGYGLGFVQAWTGHAWITNLRYEEGEFNFLKNRRDRGLASAMEYRDGLAPSGFNISKSRRATGNGATQGGDRGKASSKPGGARK